MSSSMRSLISCLPEVADEVRDYCKRTGLTPKIAVSELLRDSLRRKALAVNRNAAKRKPKSEPKPE